jgi:hypothetical protein
MIELLLSKFPQNVLQVLIKMLIAFSNEHSFLELVFFCIAMVGLGSFSGL